MKTWFEPYKRWWETAFFVLSGTIQALVNAASVVQDYQRRGESIDQWQPYLWELSSLAVLLLLIPLVLWFDRYFPLRYGKLRINLLAHLAATLVFSLVHIIGMVLIRQWGYHLAGESYDFGSLSDEFWYEYRKDLLTYITIMFVVYNYRFILSRLRGEAKEIEIGEDSTAEPMADRFLVKKLGKEFIIRLADIEWIEAAGNYVNLHSKGRIYPLRSTMTSIEKRLDSEHFARIHRSSIVNLDAVSEIQPGESGDGKVLLESGVLLNFSRNYRSRLRSAL